MTQEPINVPSQLRRTAHRGNERWLRSAEHHVDLLADVIGARDLAGASVLDVGCGTKISKLLIEAHRPIGRYVGIDASLDTVEFLRANIDDPRFEYHHLDVHNERYNPTGSPMRQVERLPVEDGAFDVIGLFSVFTHLAPHDYREMLRLLRPCVRPAGRLVLSLFLNETSSGGHGFIDSRQHLADAVVTRMGDPDPAVARAARDTWAAAESGEIPDFVDFEPGNVLAYAVYSRRHALELVDDSDWAVEAIRPPTPYIQHHFICRPV